MADCTYRFKDAAGQDVTITGKAAMVEGRLDHLLPGGLGRGGDLCFKFLPTIHKAGSEFRAELGDNDDAVALALFT